MVYVSKTLDEAEADLIDSLEWYRSQGGDDLSKRFFDAYYQTRKRILAHPEAASFLYAHFRSLRIKKFPFKIIYTVDENTILIVAIAHDKRNPDFWKGRIAE